MDVQPILNGILFLLGVGFLLANARILFDYVRSLRRGSLLTWPGQKSPYYGVTVAMGILLACLVCFKIYVGRQAFGEGMMALYYVGLMPLRQRIHRGFYQDGIWADSSFVPYGEIGGISWREGEHQVTLIVISRVRSLARRLVVPGDKYGAARRLLRDKISAHAIHFAGTGLDLVEHDERDDV